LGSVDSTGCSSGSGITPGGACHLCVGLVEEKSLPVEEQENEQFEKHSETKKALMGPKATSRMERCIGKKKKKEHPNQKKPGNKERRSEFSADLCAREKGPQTPNPNRDIEHEASREWGPRRTRTRGKEPSSLDFQKKEATGRQLRQWTCSVQGKKGTHWGSSKLPGTFEREGGGVLKQVEISWRKVKASRQRRKT